MSMRFLAASRAALSPTSALTLSLMSALMSALMFAPTFALTFSPAARAQPASAPVSTPAAPKTAPATAPVAAPAADVSEGKVAYYGRKFAGRKTASGERFNPDALTMAHKTLPFGTLVRVTNLQTKKSVVVRVNDRGPTTADRVGDLSPAAASRLRMLRSGVVDAKLEVVGTRKARRAKKA